MFHSTIRLLALAVIFLSGVIWSAPAKAQESPDAEAPPISETIPGTPDSNAARTTRDIRIPVEELRLLVRPLTIEELEVEAAAWLRVLKNKVREISEAEIVIRRQNQAIAKQEEAARALETARSALAEAEEAQAQAATGSPEYEEAARQMETAKQNIREARTALAEAEENHQELQEETAFQLALARAAETGEREAARTALDAARRQLEENITPGTPPYEARVEKIDALEETLLEVEVAREAVRAAEPGSAEAAEATRRFSTVLDALKTAREALEALSAPEEGEADAETEANEEAPSPEAAAPAPEEAAAALEKGGDLANSDDQLEESVDQLRQSAEADAAVKNQMVVAVTELMDERTAIVDRFNVVLDELESKGGETASYSQFIQAIGVVEVDVQDTEGMALRLVSWLKSEEGGMRWAGNIGKFVGILLLSILVAQLFGVLLGVALARFSSVSRLLREFLVVLVKRGGIVAGVLLGLTALEVSLGPILALVGGASFVLAFALQSNLGNFASGLMLMVYKPFDLGDEIQMNEIWGYVDSISLANTRIRGFGGQIINIPNNTVWSSTITNLTQSQHRKATLCFRIPLGQSLSKSEAILMEVAEGHPLILNDPQPFTFPYEFEEYFISVYFGFFTKTDEFWSAWPDVIRQIQIRFNEEKLCMAVPEQNVRIDGRSKDPMISPNSSDFQGGTAAANGQGRPPSVQPEADVM